VSRRLCYSLGRGILRKAALGVLRIQLMTIPLSSICAAFSDKHKSFSAPVSGQGENQSTCARSSAAGRNKLQKTN
jgi:hypothetical protein